MTTQWSFNEPQLISASDAARALGLSHSGVWRIIQSGHLPGRKLGRNYVIDTEVFAEFTQRYVKGAHRRKSTSRKNKG